jgi:Fe-S-cluster containining protein
LAPNVETSVPCDGCTECCRSGQGLVLHPEEGDDVDAYRHRIAGYRDDGSAVHVLETNEKGWCVYLGARGCTIYERRPILCRTFDCRKHYLILPREDRDNLVRLNLSSRAVFNAGRARLKTLSPPERAECRRVRDEYFLP